MMAALHTAMAWPTWKTVWLEAYPLLANVSWAPGATVNNTVNNNVALGRGLLRYGEPPPQFRLPSHYNAVFPTRGNYNTSTIEAADFVANDPVKANDFRLKPTSPVFAATGGAFEQIPTGQGPRLVPTKTDDARQRDRTNDDLTSVGASKASHPKTGSIQSNGQCAFTAALPGQILSGYAKGYSPTKQPYTNSLAAAKSWCCLQGPSICGGITHQAGTFDARQGCQPRHCGTGCANVSSFILDQPHGCPDRPGPGPVPGGGQPPVDVGVWPIPLSVKLVSMPARGAPQKVASTFAVTVAPGAPKQLVSAAARYETIIQKSVATAADRSGAAAPIIGATVQVSGSSTKLTFETDYSYTLRLPSTGTGDGVGNMKAAVTATSIFGAMYGLETLAQIFINGTLAGKLDGATIADAPAYRYRGLMLDTGRRFIPKPDILNSLDAMSAAKMNVLHLHLSDDQRCAVDSALFPNLTGHLKGDAKMGGSYTHQDVTDIVKFASDRGIIVVRILQNLVLL